MLANVILSLALATSALAAPMAPHMRRDLKTNVKDIAIHESCAGPKQRVLEQAIQETYEVAEFAVEYITTNGPSDPVFQLYFGDKKEAYPTAIGAYEGILKSNKEGALLRCDNPDGNCAFDGWRGHWRGENGTSETVICDASYTDRLFNAHFCTNGFVLAKEKPQLYWSIDLIHRFYHVPAIANDAVAHYANDLGAVVALAKENSTYSPIDSNALQYFAAHVYALEVAKGGEACIGDIAGTHSHGDAHGSDAAPAAATTTEAAPAPAQSTEAPAAQTTPAPAPTSSAPAGSSAGKECHTHADGTEHCE